MRISLNTILVTIAVVGLVTVAACSGSHGSGGKTSDNPLLVNVRATPAQPWLNGIVTFTATCVSASSASGGQSNDAGLEYVWTYKDSKGNILYQNTTTELPPPRSGGTDTYAFTVAGADSYSVKCVDNNSNGASTTSPEEIITVAPYDLSSLASNACSSGYQGFGWCWQNPQPTGSTLKSISATSPLVAWVAGDSGTVLQTTNGGATWDTKYPTVSSNLLAVRAVDLNTAYIVSDDGHVLTTTDAGASWSLSTAAQPENVTSASILSATNAWAITGGTNIVETTDGGNTWNSSSANVLPTGTQLNAIAGVDSSHAWVVGNDGGNNGITGLLTTSNGSSTWASYSTLASDIDPAAVADGVAVNLTSVSLTKVPSECPGTPKSTPSVWIGGYSTFNPIKSKGNPLRVNPLSLTATSNAGGAFAGPALVRSTDGQLIGGVVIFGFGPGNAWAAGEIGNIAYLTAPTTFSEGLAQDLATTTFVNLLSQTYTYNTWFSAALTAPVPEIHALASPDCQHGWAVGNAGTILFTADGTHSWRSQYPTMSSLNADLLSVSAASFAQAYAISSAWSNTFPEFTTQFEIFETVDGGSNWTTAVNTGSGGTSGPFNGPPGQIASVRVNTITTTVAVGPGVVISAQNGLWDTTTNESTVTAVPFATSVSGGQWASVSAASIPGSASAGTAWITDPFGDVLEEDLPVAAGFSDWKAVSVSAATYQALGTSPSIPDSLATLLTSSQTLNAIAAIDQMSALVVGTSGLIAYTGDKGVTWAALSSGTSHSLNAVVLATSNGAPKCVLGTSGVGWAVGDQGTILTTSDCGAHWSNWSASKWTDKSISFDALANYNFTAVSSANGTDVWAIGQSSTCTALCAPIVIYSPNAGGTWASQGTGAGSLTSVSALDANTAWMVGRYGSIMKTLTGGKPPSLN